VPAVDEQLLAAEIERVLTPQPEQQPAAAETDGFPDATMNAMSAAAAPAAAGETAAARNEGETVLPSSGSGGAVETGTAPSVELQRLYATEEEWELAGLYQWSHEATQTSASTRLRCCCCCCCGVDFMDGVCRWAFERISCSVAQHASAWISGRRRAGRIPFGRWRGYPGVQ
jgi:hypothetical protein